MKYISEINEFYDWLETNNLPKSAIALWHALMHIANKARWPESFAVAISTIESKTGFKRSELFEARNILQQRGRIEWKSRNGNQSAEYKLIPICARIADAEEQENDSFSNSVRIADTSADAKAYDLRTQKHTKEGTIIRQDYTNTQTRQDTSVANATGAAAAAADLTSEKLSADTSEAKERKKSSAQKKKEEKDPPTEHWKAFVSEWFRFYAQQFNGAEPSFTHSPDAREALKLLIAKLKNSLSVYMAKNNQDWTEGFAVDWFRKFLIRAWETKFYRDNFLLKNLNQNFDAIKNSHKGASISGTSNGAGVIPSGRDYSKAKL